MNPKAIVTEFYLAIERATGQGSVDKARAAARSIGVKFTNAESSLWLKEFTQSAGFTAGKRRENGVAIEHETAGILGGQNGLAGDKVVPSTSPSSEPSGSSQPTLGLKIPKTDETVKAGKILDAVWPLVADRVAPAMKRGTWRTRNIRAAREMAHLPVDAILAAHAALAAERGEVIYTLSWVHERLLRGDLKTRKPEKVVPIGPDWTGKGLAHATG